MDLAPLPPTWFDVDPAAVHDEYVRRDWTAVSDERIFALAAAAVSIPKQDPASSFALHAPLELLARLALLPYLRPGRRAAARERMVAVAATYARAAAPVEAVAAVPFASPADATAALTDATAAGDLDTVDAAATWLAANATVDEVLALTGAVIDRLSAAGHATIYFHLLGRTAAHNRAALALLRPLAREVARAPELRIEWTRSDPIGAAARAGADASTFSRALAHTPQLGLPGTDFIYPIVHQVDGAFARDIVSSRPSDHRAVAQSILRVAAQSMLQDDAAFAPYGWSHCLTLPQSVLGIRPWIPRPSAADDIAATYVVAFRAAEGGGAIDPNRLPDRGSTPWAEALDAGPAVAASAAFHARPDERFSIVADLAARAASHEDAHLAKYTLACLHAAADDPAAEPLYLAAAAFLSAWWATRA